MRTLVELTRGVAHAITALSHRVTMPVPYRDVQDLVPRFLTRGGVQALRSGVTLGRFISVSPTVVLTTPTKIGDASTVVTSSMDAVVATRYPAHEVTPYHG